MLLFLPTKRASEMMASGLPIKGARPNSPPRELSVGPATFCLPTRAVSTWAMTPLPALVGPTFSKILCRSRRPEITYPNHSPSAAMASGS